MQEQVSYERDKTSQQCVENTKLHVYIYTYIVYSALTCRSAHKLWGKKEQIELILLTEPYFVYWDYS